MFETIKNKLKISSSETEENKGKKKKTENIIFLIILLIVTVIIINNVWSGDSKNSKELTDKVLAKTLESESTQTSSTSSYNETKTESTTEEKDTEGGTRNVTQTDTQKEIAYTSESGQSAPITEKIIMPTIEGAIITAEGASNVNVKANIISATQAVTGLATHKIQVFQMQNK